MQVHQEGNVNLIYSRLRLPVNLHVDKMANPLMQLDPA